MTRHLANGMALTTNPGALCLHQKCILMLALLHQ
jgi:hypothetical protein